MRRLTPVMVGASALSIAFVGGIAVAGGFAGSGSSSPEPHAPDVRPVSVTGPDALRRFADCDELQDWYVRQNLADIGPYGWKGGAIRYYGSSGRMPMELGITQLSSALDARQGYARSISATGTNTQEAGVDEPDTAKTDGRLVVHLDRTGRLVVTDVSGPRPVRASSMQLPGQGGGSGLLLVGERVYVTEATGYYGGDWGPWFAPDQGSRISEIDITDPANPRLVRTREYDGSVQSVSQYGDVVRVVTAKARPELAWTAPGGGISKAEATRRNRALLEETSAEDWLPSVVEVRDGKRLRVDCEDVQAPPADAGTATTAVFTWDGDDVSSLALTADPGVVYSSPDRLYLASAQVTPARGKRVPATTTTYLHSFALDGATTSYVASGHVDGTVRDRWSLDEQDGRLRVAFNRPGRKGERRRDNAVAVLAEQDGRLTASGVVAGLGVREDIQSVRWYDDFAVVVTYRQVDPLYTISFKDPSRPRLLGKLKIPGFSSYLHPLGDGRLLGLGQDATSSGRTTGGQAAIFDIDDLAEPRQLRKKRFAPGTDLVAGYEPHAFIWLPGRAGRSGEPGDGTAYTLIQPGWTGEPIPLGREFVPMPRGYSTRVAVLQVRGDRLDARVLRVKADPGSRILPLGGGRLVLVGNGVQLFGG